MMKKTLLSLFSFFAVAMCAGAQNWNMVITRADGKRDTVPTSGVKNISFCMADENADQVIIKELYNGGCPLDQGSGFFQKDKGFILYNNSSRRAVVNNLCVGILQPYNAHASNGWFDDSGNLIYASEGYVPAVDGIWYFQTPVVIEPYSQIVVSCMGAVNNTLTHSKSVNYANSDYYAMYDVESGYNNTSWYPAPADVIPTSHYLKAVRVGQANAWPLSVTSPAFFIFRPNGVTPADFATNADNIVYVPGKPQTPPYRCIKVPVAWILDGVEVYSAGEEGKSHKRFTPDVDAGYVKLTNKLGHSLYRNVDKEATEALPENSGKLVMGYAMGAAGTDPSGIDAEASARRGAHIVYKDNNNSSEDFHERRQFSLRDN